jgi:hypothetical protein
MGFFPYPPHVPLSILNVSARYSAGAAWNSISSGFGSPASAVWPSANLALYFPLMVPWNYPVKRVMWANGGVVSGNVDLGIFKADTGAKIASTGATAQAGTSAVQYVSVDWLIPEGEYYLGLSFSSGTAQVQRSTTITAAILRMTGVLQEASAHPLPTTMTPAAMASAYVPIFGLTRMSSY